VSKLKIPLGLRDGLLLAPSEVPNGLACGCSCPGCGAQLIAKHPREKIAHFAHHSTEACLAGYETALHLAAKKVLLQRREVVVPGISAQSSLYDRETGAEVTVSKTIASKNVTLDSVEEESREFEGIVPDIIATFNGKLLFIEIAVTHFVDDAKLEKLQQIGIPAFEIDLSYGPELPTLAEIEQIVIRETINRNWLFNPRKEALQRVVDEKAQQDLAERVARTLESRALLQEQHELYLKLPDKEKLRIEVASTGLPFSALRSFVGKQVRGARSFGVSSHVWQTALYHRFIHGKQGHNVDVEEVCSWLSKHLTLCPPFPNAEKVAVWDFLTSLATLGMLRRDRGQTFYVYKDATGQNLPY